MSYKLFRAKKQLTAKQKQSVEKIEREMTCDKCGLVDKESIKSLFKFLDEWRAVGCGAGHHKELEARQKKRKAKM